MQQIMLEQFDSNHNRMGRSFHKCNRNPYSPFWVKVLNPKVLIPKK